MKRLQLRHAQRILTLSLLGSLALLAACGGGGGGKSGAPAEPAAVVPKDKSVVEAADPNEPYLVAPSGWSTRQDGQSMRLNIIDGIRQEVKATIDFGATDGDKNKQWMVAEKFVKGASQFTRVPASLFFIKDHRLFRTGLSRAEDPQDQQQLSDSTKLCTIEATYPLKYSSPDAAVVATVSTGTNACGSPSDQTVVITSTMTADDIPIVPPTQAFRHLQNLYDDSGALKGMLVEKTLSPTTAQMAVWSPNMATEITAKVELKYDAIDYSVYPLKSGDAAYGAQWITYLPNTDLAGYVRVKVVTAAATLTTPEVTNTYLYQIDWTGTGGPTATVIKKYAMDDNAATNLGVSDDKYAYFVDGTDLAFGPFPNVNAPLRRFSIEPLVGQPNAKLKAIAQSPKHVVMTFQSGDDVSVYAMDKLNGAWGILGLGKASEGFRLLGLRGEKAFSVVKNNNQVGTFNIVQADMSKIDLNNGAQILLDTILPSVVVVGGLYEQTTNFSLLPEINSLIACSPDVSIASSCHRKTMKVFDLATKAYTQEIGMIESLDSRQVSIAGGGYFTTSNILLATRTLTSGPSDVVTDVWTFHPSAPHSLKQVVAPDPTAVTTPSVN